MSVPPETRPAAAPPRGVTLPAGLEGLEPDIRLDGTDDLGDRMVLNMGPQHPSTHGVLRIVLEIDGERVVKATPDVGYLHRGMEKLGETLGYHRFIPYTDRLDYLAPLSNNCAIALAAERVCGIEAPPETWRDRDITEAYHAARRQVFETCRRTVVTAGRGEAYLVHRLALHGIAPWGDGARADRRMVIYFRPESGDPEAWLRAP